MKIISLIFAAAFSLCATIAMASEPLVTFVCTGNTGRSPMAEALAKNLVNKEHLNIIVQSRGVKVDPKETAPEEGTVTVLKERGIEIGDHKATPLSEDDVKNSTLLLTMTEKHKQKVLADFPEAKGHVFTLAEYANGKHEDIIDAYGEPLEAYKKVEGQLDVLLPLALDKVAKGEKQ